MNIYSFFNRYDKSFIRFSSICIVIISIISLIFICLTPQYTINAFGLYPGSDYPGFYIAGKILNHYSYDQLYNLDLQFEILQSLRPNHDAALPNPYPPFFNLLFKPLARLPFISSYFTWLFISVSLYLLGIFLLRRSCRHISRDDFTTAFLLAVSFEPFIIETCIGGQSSACGFFILSLTVFLEKSNRPLLAGLVLGFALYKPPLLLIILPFLLATKRFKVFTGFLICAVLLAIISLVIVGPKACSDWLQIQIDYSKASTVSSDVFREFKFVDISSFLRLLFGDLYNISRTILLIIIGVSSLSFVAFSAKHRGMPKDLMWASALSFTIIINCYMPIYDTIIIVIGMFLTKNYLDKNNIVFADSINVKFNTLLAFIFITPWFTQHISRYIGLQIFTLLILVVGIYQAWLIHRVYNVSITKTLARQR